MRAYRSPAETRLSGVFSAATTRMQSAGHAAAQSEQPTHFSRPFSCLCRRCRPRKRGYTGRLYSGYCCVIGFLNSCRKVTAKPLTGANGSATSEGHDQEGRDDGVDRRDGEQDLPPEGHQLVVAEPWQRRLEPDEDGDRDEQL